MYKSSTFLSSSTKFFISNRYFSRLSFSGTFSKYFVIWRKVIGLTDILENVYPYPPLGNCEVSIFINFLVIK